MDPRETMCEVVDCIQQNQNIPVVNSCGNIPWSCIIGMLFICQLSNSFSQEIAPWN
jgi:hypothetical protein